MKDKNVPALKNFTFRNLNLIRGKWLYKNPKVFDEIKPLIDELHTYGTKIFFQLGIFVGRNATIPTQAAKLIDNKFIGFLAKPVYNVKDQLVSADDGVPSVFMPEYKCRALTTGEVEHLVQAYAKTALLCKNAGIDGVEVHAVHEGYLMDQFTLPYTNHRTDKYGGSFENRYRFAAETVQEIKKLCGADYPVPMRYSVTSKTIGFNCGAVPGEDFVEAGRTMEESEKAIKLLEEAGVDMFSCDNGTYDAWFWSHPPVYMPLNCNLEEVKHIKKFTNVPVYCAGRMQMPVAEEAIENGEIDGVAIGRQFLCDENFLTKIRSGREEEIRPCISCHAGCLPVATYKGAGVEMDMAEHADSRMCALNPRTFTEKKYTPVPAKNPKHFAVIGGGLTGCEIAYELVLSGKKPCIIEMLDDLIKVKGVCYANSSMLKELMRYYKVPVYLEAKTTEIKDGAVVIETKDGVKELPADTVITSIGYEAGTPFDGIEDPRIHAVGDAKKVGNLKSVIWGANDLVLELTD